MAEGAAGAAQAAGGDAGAAQGAGAAAVLNGDGKGVPDFINRFPENAREYVSTKGWKNETDILTSYQNLHSAHTKLSQSNLPMPKEGDAASEAEFRKARGVPESADKYDIKLPEGASIDPAFLSTAKGWMHEAGLSPKEAQVLASKWNDFTAAQMKDTAAAKLKASEEGLQAVEKEWGNQTDANKAAAQRAFKAVAKDAGMEAADLDTIEDAIGTSKMLKMFARIGNMIGEARFVDGAHAGGSHLTPEAARARLQQMNADPAFRAKIMANDMAAVEERKRVIEAAAAGMAA